MSNYKVGDLASLMSPTTKKEGTKLQSLFNEHYNKKKIPNAKNTGHKSKSIVSNCDIKSNATKKSKKEKIPAGSPTIDTLKKEMKTDLDLDFLPLHSKKLKKKKQRNNFSDESVIEDDKQNLEHSKNVKGFIRCVKNKRQKTDAQEIIGTINTKPMHVKDNLFSEITESTSCSQSKKKKNQSNQNSSSNFSSEVPRAENIQDLPHTLFIGNLPVSVNRKVLYKLFSSFGRIKSVRLRGAVSAKMNMPKKVAEIKSEYHKGLQSHTGFVVFKDEESAKNALALNGTLIDEHHILVDFAKQAGEKKLYNNDLSVFLGNLPFDVADETVRSAFEECGEIQAVRIIRDKNTGLGKGFGYIQFQKIKSKEKALTLDGVEINGRKTRVKPIDSNRGEKGAPKKTLMMIRKNVAAKRTKESGTKKSVKKLLKKGKHIHQKKRIARLLGEKFVK